MAEHDIVAPAARVEPWAGVHAIADRRGGTMSRGHDEDEPDSRFDDLVLVVVVEPGPTFRIAEVGGRPVARGAVSPAAAAGLILDASDTTAHTTSRGACKGPRISSSNT